MSTQPAKEGAHAHQPAKEGVQGHDSATLADRAPDPGRGAVIAAAGILRDLLDGDTDPGYWRLRIGHALDALDTAAGS